MNEQSGDLIANGQQDIIKMYRDGTLPLAFASMVHMHDAYVRYLDKANIMQLKTYPINVSKIVRELPSL